MMQGIVEFLIQNGQSLFGLILCGTIGYGVYLLVQEYQQQASSPCGRRSSVSSTAIKPSTLRNVTGKFRPSHPLHGKLVKLLRGDQKAAARLLASYQAKFPDKSEQWHYEKAIYDLSRDRH